VRPDNHVQILLRHKRLSIRGCPDPRFFYKLPHVQEALACLQYGIASRKGFVVMTGEVGTGKTTLLKTVLSSLRSGGFRLHLFSILGSM